MQRCWPGMPQTPGTAREPRQSSLAVRKVTELTLTFDHRVCDGGTAAGFLRFVADAIENPNSVLADI
ncbi:MAG: hypothetical protein NVS2B15_22490 [Pseudarthrobacter sp.]